MQEGDAPLHCALSRGDRPTVKLLLKKGANKEAKNKVSSSFSLLGLVSSTLTHVSDFNFSFNCACNPLPALLVSLTSSNCIVHARCYSYSMARQPGSALTSPAAIVAKKAWWTFSKVDVRFIWRR